MSRPESRKWKELKNKLATVQTLPQIVLILLLLQGNGGLQQMQEDFDEFWWSDVCRWGWGWWSFTSQWFVRQVGFKFASGRSPPCVLCLSHNWLNYILLSGFIHGLTLSCELQFVKQAQATLQNNGENRQVCLLEFFSYILLFVVWLIVNHNNAVWLHITQRSRYVLT